ncbi:MAG: DMT family transporter [Tabrizicola sp.]|uniref:DMT family transporter n=1 Tax=Tabrizicola sp. TaxID=2005166 RepID=UPI002736DE36|nr:DMT family transporter [Tabrizicola sp.]MDP3262630.1 DMT family transporter [Tabrizicola sp.]MDP3647790.1 DMT family transporter [Paracoccaceae bacterium]MDZ4065566.1 DMT family transporter [Tabrizicola sp.]
MTEAQRGHLAMLAFSALVAGSFSLGALAAPFVDPAALSALRFFIAAVLVGMAAAATTGLPRRAFAAPWRYLLLGALLAAYFVLMFEGLRTAAPVSAAAVFTLTPVMAAGFGWLFLRQRMTGRMALALAIGAAGALVVIFRGRLSAMLGLNVGVGEVTYFWGCVAHAAYAPLVRKLNRGEPAIVFTFGMMVAGTALLTVWAWPAIRATDWAALPAIVWITLAYVAVAASAVTFVLLQYATLRLPAAKVMAYTYLVPAWVILWEISLHGAWPPGIVLAGVAMTGLGLWLLLKE